MKNKSAKKNILELWISIQQHPTLLKKCVSMEQITGYLKKEK